MSMRSRVLDKWGRGDVAQRGDIVCTVNQFGIAAGRITAVEFVGAEGGLARQTAVSAPGHHCEIVMPDRFCIFCDHLTEAGSTDAISAAKLAAQLAAECRAHAVLMFAFAAWWLLGAVVVGSVLSILIANEMIVSWFTLPFWFRRGWWCFAAVCVVYVLSWPFFLSLYFFLVSARATFWLSVWLYFTMFLVACAAAAARGFHLLWLARRVEAQANGRADERADERADSAYSNNGPNNRTDDHADDQAAGLIASEQP